VPGIVATKRDPKARRDSMVKLRKRGRGAG
jgi:hypothetical protein